ncbi:hypothetical protein F5Y06DRAFT_35313 [Hypoxylon sp. FL0890]|nr:hypothetical protein F5Y06DRAFT_35313 [Hypoxylon sp. FL0890]
MLEKTAASLEPCGFHRVVPGATQSFRTTRQLRNTFWQHAATDIELTAAWQALMHGTFDLNMGSTSEENRSSSLSASAFLLDFLYPSGAVTLMRRISMVIPVSGRRDNLRYGQRFAKIGPRPYTSSVPRQRVNRPETKLGNRQEGYEAGEGTSVNGVDATDLNDTEATEMGRTPDMAHMAVNGTVQEADVETPETLAEPDVPLDETEYSSANGHTEALDKLLESDSDDPEDADRVWYHYRALDAPSQTFYLEKVLDFLSKSGRLSDSWKISELFHKVPLPQWTNSIFVEGVTAEINLQNDSRAVEVFIKGLQHSSIDVPYLIDALDLILASALRSDNPKKLKGIWEHYSEMATRFDFGGITSQLKHVSSVPGLVQKALEFQIHGRQELQELEDTGLGQEVLDTLQRILVRRALLSCADNQIIPLLNVTKDPLAFEEFLRSVSSRRMEEVGKEVYRIYRKLAKSIPSHAVLHEMFRAYTRLGTPISTKYAGLELLWGDWHRFHTTPSRRAFQRYLAFYASQGDTQRVYDLWTRFIELYRADPSSPILKSDDTFAHLLHVHAVRGELEETQRIFNDISLRFGIKPNTYYWNILLNAHAKAGDYDGAISTFEKLMETGKPDRYSYGTMMQMAGSRGDLGFTIELYRQGLSKGVRPDDAILSSLIDAYCQNDYMKEAQDVCLRAVRKGIVVTRMWNKLLGYHALRRDLATINKVLELMAENNVPYNQFTYKQLLLGLALCRQSQHALNLLSVALKDNIFEVVPDHFHIVMGALLINGEPGPVQRIYKMMQDYGFARSSTTLFRVTQALGQWKNLAPKQRARLTATEWLGRTLRSFNRIYGLDSPKKLSRLSPPTPNLGRSGELLGQSTEKSQFSTMVYMLTEMKNFFEARQLVDLYRFIFQGPENSDGVLPIIMLNSVMLADFQENKYDRVCEIWDVLFENAKKEARSADFVEELPHTSKISPKYRYVLSAGVGVMQKLLFNKGDAAGLQSLVEEVRSAGFELDSKNWNYYVQALVQLREYKAAFITCENILMPNWTGWFVVRNRENVQSKLPLDLRRKGTSPRHLRPVATTLYHLARGYMELDRLGPWSAEAARTSQEIEKECVQVIRAIKSMIRVHSKLEYEILGEEDYADFDSAELEYDQDYQDGRGDEGEAMG